MEQRPLGRIGHASSVVIFGAAAFYATESVAEAQAALDLALAHGINHIDIAPQYGRAETVAGPWLAQHRAQVFLGCKTLERTREAAWAELQRSLALLHAGAFDLYQFHAVTTFEELDMITGPGGAAEAFQQAQDAGLVRALGITSHGMLAPRIALAALERLDLAAVMLPLNPRLYAEADYRAGMEQLLEVCQARQVGVQAIKAAARGPWGDQPKRYNPWYEPYDVPERITAALRFVLSQPGVTCAVAPAEVALLPVVIQAAEAFVPMSAAEQAATIAAFAGDALIFAGPHVLGA